MSEKGSSESKPVFRVTIFPNGTKLRGKVAFINEKDSWEEFLSRCNEKLELNCATRVFNESGADLTKIEDILPNDVLFISSGSNFVIPTESPSDWVTLNVGGSIFSTTRSTLLKDPSSMLAKMFGEEWESRRDINGNYLIDRTPEYFRVILNFLRCGSLVLDDKVNAEGVLAEANFFNISSIIAPLKQIVSRSGRKQNSLTRKELVSILLTSSVNSSLRCQGLDLADVDLSKLDLSHINFKMTDFTNANLEKANLDQALLQEANLSGANLQLASLRGANLGGANLEHANLRGANFEDRGGLKANLEGAKLKGASLEDCNFSGANLRAANLKGCNLENANLRRADLAGADLEGVNLRGANLNKANLIGANLVGANFDIRTTTPWG